MEGTMADFVIKQGSTGPAILDQLLNEDGSPVDLTGATAKFLLSSEDSGRVGGEATVVDARQGKVAYNWATEDTRFAGNYMGEWRITFPDGRVETYPSDDYKRIRVKPAL
jgi:hypothetical protein